jgi:hemoglobin
MEQSCAALSLYAKIGGEDAVRATVIRMYDKILQDELLIPFFENVDVSRLRKSQEAFVTMAFGGPHHYTGKTLRAVHQPLVLRGLSDRHFDAVIGHMVLAMKEMGVSADLIEEAQKIVEQQRSDVLCKEGDG